MVNDENRNEDELLEVPSITLQDDDLEGRRTASRSRTAQTESAIPVVPGSMARGTSAGSGKAVTALLGLFLLLALAGVAWLYQELQVAQQQIGEAADRINRLEGRLTSTDTTITKSEVLLANKLNKMDELMAVNKDEIRKLWGVSYDTNRKAIEQNKQINDQQAQTLKQIQQQGAQNLQRLNQQQASIEAVQQSAKNSESSAREAVQRMELAQEKITTLSSDVSALKQKQVQIDADSKKRLGALEDTAKSTDVFRRNTQEELRKLRDELMRQSMAISGASAL